MRCETTFLRGECVGIHEGKFSSCLDYALWTAADDAHPSDRCGDLDFGHATKVTTTADESLVIGEGTDAEAVVVAPAGFWIVWETTGGAVAATHFDSDVDRNVRWLEWESAFEAWAGDDGGVF